MAVGETDLMARLGFCIAVNCSHHIKRLMAGLLILCLFKPLHAANDPWVSKSAAEWDKADVHKILYSSPWVKHFTRTKRDLEFEVPDLGPSGVELRGYHAKESKENGVVATDFYVRWVSSRTLRRAMARRIALMMQLKPGLEETTIPPMLDDLEIAIAGSDMSAFARVHDAKFKAKCYLVTSSTVRIHPTRVEFARSNDGKIRGILFHFPRKTGSGEPVISTHETRVWFFEGAAEIQISVTFQPQTMIDEKGLDL